MRGKKAKEKRFEDRVESIVQSITRIDVKPGEVLFIELDNRINKETFAMVSKTFKSVFKENRVNIIFGAHGVVKKMTAVAGDVIRRVPDSDKQVAAAKESIVERIREEKSQEPFESFREKMKEGEM